jgi:hypothetical protein
MQLAALAAVISYFWRDVSDLLFGSLSAIGRRDFSDRSLKLAFGSAYQSFSQCDPVHTCSTTYRNIIGNATDGRAGLVVAFANPIHAEWTHERCRSASANFVREIGK